MVGCRYEHYVRWKVIQEEQQVADQSADLASLVIIGSLLGQRIEFIQEQDTRAVPNPLERVREALCGLTQQTSDHPFVSEPYEREHQRIRKRRRNTCFSGPGPAIEQDPMSRLQPVVSKELATVLFLNQLLKIREDHLGQD